MAKRKTRACYVKTSKRQWLVQLPDKNPWGFVLADDDQTWAGGFGIASNWKCVPAKKVPKRVRERLGWMLPRGKA